MQKYIFFSFISSFICIFLSSQKTKKLIFNKKDAKTFINLAVPCHNIIHLYTTTISVMLAKKSMFV